MSSPTLKDKPTLVTLEQFPCEIGGTRPNIVAIVANHYRPIGTLLLDDKDGSKVDNIEREALRNPEETMRGIFKTWLKQDTDCSWEKFINFLRQVKLNVFAKDIEDALRECKEPTEEISDSQTQSDMLVSLAADLPDACGGTIEAVKSKIKELIDKFQSLKEATRDQLEKEGIGISCLVDIITSLPAPRKEPHEEFLATHTDVLLSCQNIAGVFIHLNMHWEYLNYDILAQIITAFPRRMKKQKCLPWRKLIGQLSSYRVQLRHFVEQTTLEQFQEADEDKRFMTPPEGFKELVTRHTWEKPILLKNVVDFRDKFAHKYNLRKCAIFLLSMADGSVIITMLVPKSIEKTIDLTDVNFFNDNGILQLQLSGVTLYEQDLKFSAVRRNPSANMIPSLADLCYNCMALEDRREVLLAEMPIVMEYQEQEQEHPRQDSPPAIVSGLSDVRYIPITEEYDDDRSHISTASSSRAPHSVKSTVSHEKGQQPSQQLPRARYLIKLEKKKESCIAPIVKLLQRQGLECEVEKRHVIVTADAGKLKSQAEKLKWMKQLKNSEEVDAFSVEYESKFVASDGKRLFSSAECSLLLYHCIDTIPFTCEEIQEVHECKELKKDKGFLSALRLCKPPLVKKAYPLHEEEECQQLKTMLHWSWLPTKSLDLQSVRNYFGDEVGFYFGWMFFYMKFICAPLVISLVMYALRPGGITVNTDPYLPFFSIMMAMWGVLFLVFWQRRSNTLSFSWNTYKLTAADDLRQEYHGYTAIDPVTLKPSVHYPHWRRRLWYLVSVAAMLPLLSVGVGVMTLSLNLNGYVKSTDSPIYVETIARFAQPGGLFAGDSPYFLWLVPTLGHSVCVSIINRVYSKVAKKCTDMENHRTVQTWHSSLVVKRVFFECFDCFMPLFYIAFYQLDVITLRAEIASLFMSDEIRRVVQETVIPLLKQLCVGRVEKKLDKADHVPDTILAEYDQFDDYLEMVIQFGYITLFASAFPLGAAVTFVFLYVEVRSDLFKLITAYRRPFARRVRDIGVWFDVMQVLVFVAILTNCIILGFSSEQLMQWLPWLYSRDTMGDQVMADRYVVGVVFGFEHLLLILALWMRHAFQPVPKKVRDDIARRSYLTEQRAAEVGKQEGGVEASRLSEAGKSKLD